MPSIEAVKACHSTHHALASFKTSFLLNIEALNLGTVVIPCFVGYFSGPWPSGFATVRWHLKNFVDYEEAPGSRCLMFDRGENRITIAIEIETAS